MANAVGFRVTGRKGFHVTFENGWTVSVQFGVFNYCANRASLSDLEIDGTLERDREAGGVGSATAETAVWGPDGNLVEVEWCMGDTVQGWQSPSAVLRLMTWAASQPVTAEVAP